MEVSTAMDHFEALRTIQKLARVALENRAAATKIANNEEGLLAAIAEMQQGTLNGILVVTEKALANAPT